MTDKEKRICPRCGQAYTDAPAISMADNATEICPKCGTVEALTAAGLDADTQAEILAAIDRETVKHHFTIGGKGLPTVEVEATDFQTAIEKIRETYPDYGKGGATDEA